MLSKKYILEGGREGFLFLFEKLFLKKIFFYFYKKVFYKSFYKNKIELNK
jgi:hypothetical protein